MGRQIRRNELHARRARRVNLKKLRARYAKAKTGADRDRILGKVARVAPSLTPEQFLATVPATA